MKKIVLSVSMLLCLSTNAFATQYCLGTINQFFVNKVGALYIHTTYRKDYTQICDVDSTWKSISVTTCKSWLAIVTAAKVSNSNVLLPYSDNYTCSTLPTYDRTDAPSYVMLKSPN